MSMTIEEQALDLITATGLTVQEYQEYYRLDLDKECQRLYGQGLRADGHIGRATSTHIFNRKCGSMDSPLHLEKEAARIPPTCSDEYLLNVDWSRLPSQRIMGLSKNQIETAFNDAMVQWRKVINLNFVLSESGSGHCLVTFNQLNGSTLAASHLADNSCDRGKRQWYDIRGWPSQDYFALVALHELGHLLGLEHLPGPNVMNPAILPELIRPGKIWLSATDIRSARQKGYDGPIDEPDEPDPDEPRPGPPSDWEIVIPQTIIKLRPSDDTTIRSEGGNR